MTDTELLEKVKTAIGITGNYHDDTLLVYISDVKEYLIDAGVSESVVNNSASVGVITRGVSDLWNYGAGNGVLSPYFYQRATQLCYKNSDSEKDSPITIEDVDKLLGVNHE